MIVTQTSDRYSVLFAFFIFFFLPVFFVINFGADVQ